MTRPSLLGGLLLVLALYGAGATYLLLVSRDRADTARRDADAAQMRAAGAVVAEPASARAVAEKAAPLAPHIARVRKAVPRAKVVEALTWRTDPVTVPCPPPAAAPSPPADATTPAKAPEVEIEVRGTEARLETDGGAVAAVGEVELWKIPGPDEVGVPVLVAAQPWRADLGRLLRAGARGRASEGWAFGPALALRNGRIGYGAIVVGPPFVLGRAEFRPAALAFTDSGGLGVIGAVVVR